MSYSLKATEYFYAQIGKLDASSRSLIEEKLDLIRENPFRFKKLHSRRFSHVFRVRLSLEGKSARLVYVVIQPNVVLVCILWRKSGYKDLERYLKRL